MQKIVICNKKTDKCPKYCEHSKPHNPLDVTTEKQCSDIEDMCLLLEDESTMCLCTEQ